MFAKQFSKLSWAKLALTLALTLCSDVALSQVTSENFITRSYRGSAVLKVATDMEVGRNSPAGCATVTITNAKGPSLSDRNLVVVLYFNPYGTQLECFSYSVPVQLAEGAKSVQVEIPFLDSGQQAAWDVAVFEGGRDIEDKRVKNRQPYQWSYTGGVSQTAYIGIQGAGETKDQIENILGKIFVGFTPAQPVTNTANGVVFATPTAQGYTGTTMPVAKTFSQWQRYLAYPYWFVSSRTLTEMCERYPENAAALRKYVASGGKLMVHSRDADALIESIEEKFLPDAKHSFGRYQFASFGAVGNTTASYTIWEEFKNSKVPEATEPSSASQVTQQILEAIESAAKQPEFLKRNYLAGEIMLVLEDIEMLADPTPQVVAQVNQNSTDSKPEKINKFEKAANEFRSKAQSALGVDAGVYGGSSLGSDGNWFWKNLIVTVGKPPVWAFAVLVALFGALLGPGLLALTGKIGRRSLMIFLVPATSIVATLIIVTYGVLHEGFETHARIASVTYFSEGEPEGFVWSRQTFFSGLPPREGLEFGVDTFARPVYPDNDNVYSLGDPRSNVDCRVSITDEIRWRGWLKARQQQQLLTGHPTSEFGLPLKVAYTSDPPTKIESQVQGDLDVSAELKDDEDDYSVQLQGISNIRIENVSDLKLPFVVIHGAAGEYYYCGALEAGDVRVVAPLIDKEAGAKVARDMVDLKPRTPPEMEGGGSVFEFGNSNVASSRYNEGDDIINRALRNYLSGSLKMKPFSFATIIEENPAVSLPVEANIENSLHIVVGELQW